MSLKHIIKKFPLFIFLFCSVSVFAQNTIVSGTVTDANTRQPMPYVTVAFNTSNIGINTNDQGKYTIRTTQKFTQIKATFVGYKPALLTIISGKEQVVNIRLFPEAQALKEVTVVSGKAEKYRNKDNPAVELIRQVIET
jgi:hypothetical protein